MTNKNDDTKAVVEAVAALEESEEILDLDEILLSSGVRLRLKPVSKHFMYGVTSQFPPPEVPLIHIEGKKRPIENPDDPDYKQAVEDWILLIASASTDVVLLRGTEIIEKPESVIGPDSEEWIDEMEVLGLKHSDNPRARYLYWLKAIAAPSDKDISDLMEVLGRLTGISELDVADAVERFRDFAVRTASS